MASRQEIDKELLAAIMQGSGRKAIQPRPMTQLREDIASLGDLMVQGGEAVEEYNEPMVNTELERFVGLLPQIFMANALKGPGSVMQLARPGAVEPIIEAIGQGVEQFKADPIGTTKSVVSSGIEAAKDPIGLAGAMQPTDVLGAGAGLGMLGKLGRVVNSKRGPDLFADVTGVDVDRPKQPISQKPNQSIVNEIIKKFSLDNNISPALTEKLKTSELLDSNLTDINNKQDLDAWIGQIYKNDPDKYQEINSDNEWWTELRSFVENNPTKWKNLRKEVGQKELRKKIAGFDKDVYHGSTFNISQFKTENLNPTSYMGRGHYFTTSPEDASVNYASLDSPDIKAKNLEIKDALRKKEIERIEKQLKELDDLSLEEQKKFNQENPGAWNALHDELWDLEKNKTDKFLSKLGEAYLHDDVYYNNPTLAKYTAEDIKAIDPNLPVIGENQGAVYDISLSVKNPFRINSDDAVFYRNYKYDSNKKLISEDEGSYGDLLDAIWEVSSEWSKNETPNLDPNKVVARFREYVDHRNADLDGEGLTPREVHRALKNITEFADKDIGYFDVMELRPEFRRQIYERLGFDSVIMNPKDAFPRLMENFDDDIEHVIVFPGYENRIRSQRAQFDPEKSHLSDLMATSTPIGVGAAGGYTATKEDE